CGSPCDGRVLALAASLRPPVQRLLALRAPGWTPAQGVCPTCADAAACDFIRGRSAFPLHTRSEPHTTFPYYHPDEERVLGLSERLPDYARFNGDGVTLGFLDSGFYPHPDLCRDPLPVGQPLDRLSARQWRSLLEPLGPRFLDYVDLSADQDVRGVDHPSLWDGQGVAWHGQMTSVIAAGNGNLSGGLYRGLAPSATLLPIKIGRGDGRVPESDLLRGFEWLLAERRSERLGLRVLNVSVGGDFAQEWRLNPVCLAAERLSERGVLVVAAAGNSGRPDLKAPATAPSVLTVGAVEDENRLIDRCRTDSIERLLLFHHTWGTVRGPFGRQRKPEVLATGRHVPGPILPVSFVWREAMAIGRLRETLRVGDSHTDSLLAHWQRVLHEETADEEATTGEWMGEVWQAVRKRMNAHKWVDAHHQHVDGTSVSAAIVSSVATQMVHANSNLRPEELRALLRETALPLFHLPAEQSGSGVIQPAVAVAAALRTVGGALTGLPHSGRVMRQGELQEWVDRIKVPVAPVQASKRRTDTLPATLPQRPVEPPHAVYFGLLAPEAARVSLVGTFNGWQPDVLLLQPAPANPGWWHLALPLPDGDYSYRFWVTTANGASFWVVDGESPLRCESGYSSPHSRVLVD
ncbi:MAG: S8 family serine peptidase, partial [Caldilineaceae bacterium]